MENNVQLIESLIVRASEYGKTSFEIIKFKTLDKTSDLLSSFLSHTVVIVLASFFLLFLNLGVALLIGEMLGTFYYGFFILAAFYALIAGILYFFLQKRFKRTICNYIIKQILH